jgi:hypothetical protein
MPKERDESRLLHAMGWETANVHLGTPKQVTKVQRDLRHRPPGWLHEASKRMMAELQTDLRGWQKHMRQK